MAEHEDHKPSVEAEAAARIRAIAAEARARGRSLTIPIEAVRQNVIGIDGDGNMWGVDPITCPAPKPPTRAEFDALLARLAAAEAEIEKLKKGRGPEAEGVI